MPSDREHSLPAWVIDELREHAADAESLWSAKRDSASASERWQSEYWRGQMNGLHHAITALEEKADA